MTKKQAKSKTLRIPDYQLAALRLDAVKIAANLPTEEAMGGQAMMGGYRRPGKTAAQVVQEARVILGFITANA